MGKDQAKDVPSAFASCNDLANFASHGSFLLGSQRRKERHTSCTQAGPQSTDWQVGSNRNG